jgi:hypothetical protein
VEPPENLDSGRVRGGIGSRSQFRSVVKHISPEQQTRVVLGNGDEIGQGGQCKLSDELADLIETAADLHTK